MSLEDIQREMRKREEVHPRYIHNRKNPTVEKKPVLALRLLLMCNCEYVVNWIRGSGNPPLVTYECGNHGIQRIRTCEMNR